MGCQLDCRCGYRSNRYGWYSRRQGCARDQAGVRRTAESGFSLLEAIVAMVLVSVAGLALFSWTNSSFMNLNRIQESNARAAAQLNALQFLQTVNPMVRPVGSTTLGKLKLDWRARVITQPQTNLLESGSPGPFTVALYEIEATMEEPPEVPPSRFTVRLMGYERLPFDADPFGDKPVTSPVKKTVPVAKNVTARSTP